MSVCRRSAGRLFHSFGPAAAKHLSVFAVCSSHNTILDVAERSWRRPSSKTNWQCSVILPATSALRCVRRKSLDQDYIATLTQAFISSRFDYWKNKYFLTNIVKLYRCTTENVKEWIGPIRRVHAPYRIIIKTVAFHGELCSALTTHWNSGVSLTQSIIPHKKLLCFCDNTIRGVDSTYRPDSFFHIFSGTTI